MNYSVRVLFESHLGILAALSVHAEPVTAKPPFEKIALVVEGVRSVSYPSLQDARIEVRGLRSDFDYFQTRFTVSSYFFSSSLRYKILFNTEALNRQAPAEGLRAIIAHELAHIQYFRNRGRIRLLGLVRLLSLSFTTRFERQTDLKAIALGYGHGLEIYRSWLYRNVPAKRVKEKKRHYYSPEEITAILRAQKQRPEIMAAFLRCIPRNLAEIEQAARNPAGRCPK